jgi:hypothetical protein
MQIKQELTHFVLTICGMRTSRHDDATTPEEENKRDISTVTLQDSEISHRVNQWREIPGEKKDEGQEIRFHLQDLHGIGIAAWAANQKRRPEVQDPVRQQDHQADHQFLVGHLSDVNSNQDMTPMIYMKRRMSLVMKETLRRLTKNGEIDLAWVAVRRRTTMISANSRMGELEKTFLQLSLTMMTDDSEVESTIQKPTVLTRPSNRVREGPQMTGQLGFLQWIKSSSN